MKLKLPVILASALVVSIASADELMSFDKLITGATPIGPAPWGRLSLTDSAPNQVTLTLANLMTASSGQFISRLLLNAQSLPSDLTMVSRDSKVQSLSWGTNAYNNAGYTFDLKFVFPTSNNSGERLAGGESATLTLRGTGLSARSLVSLSNGPDGSVTGMIHIQNIAGESGKVAAVPEPASLAALGLGVVALARKRRK